MGETDWFEGSCCVRARCCVVYSQSSVRRPNLIVCHLRYTLVSAVTSPEVYGCRPVVREILSKTT